MPRSSSRRSGVRDRGPRVGQPDVSAVHPPQHAEDEQYAQRAGREVAGQDPGELGDGEDEDQVEEEFQVR